MILRLSFYYYYYLARVLGSVVSVSLSRSNRIGAYNEKSKWNKKYLYQNSASGSQHTQQNTSFQLSKANTVLLNAVCCVWDKTRRRRRRILNANIVAWYTCNVNFVVVSCSLESDCLAHNSLSFYISCSACVHWGHIPRFESTRRLILYVLSVSFCVCVWLPRFGTLEVVQSIRRSVEIERPLCTIRSNGTLGLCVPTVCSYSWPIGRAVLFRPRLHRTVVVPSFVRTSKSGSTFSLVTHNQASHMAC